MRRVFRFLTGCTIAVALSPAAAAAQGDPCAVPTLSLAAECPLGSPSVSVFVNGRQVGSVEMTWSGKLVGGTWSGGVVNEWQATLSTTMNPDPFIIFSLGGTNFTNGTLTFGFLFNLPIVPGAYNSASSSLAGTVTRTDVGPIGGTATVTPTFANVLRGVGQPGATNLGVDLGNLGCSVTTDPGPPTVINPRSANCGFAGSAASSFAPTNFNGLQALVDFDVTGGNTGGFFGASAASFTGSLIINAVPEPSTYVLMLGGLVALAGGVRLRRRAS